MDQCLPFLAVLLLVGLAPLAAGESTSDPADWTIYVANDNCPDYTWGLTEAQTRKAFADIVRGHLDEMKRTDNEAPENRDRYNMAVTHEALCFVEHYPDRKDELIRRIREGRICVSPFLCNSLWAFQSVEGFIRTLYPARRLERDWGIPIGGGEGEAPAEPSSGGERGSAGASPSRGAQGAPIRVAEHIELPSLPWGTATLLAGCGVRWLLVPFYNYDSAFASLKNPPLFILEGPDGSPLRVVMDPWASNRANYTQGAQILREPKSILADWLPHYRELAGIGDVPRSARPTVPSAKGDTAGQASRGTEQVYPLRAILASGTHGDISPGSGAQARGFADAIKSYNASPGPHPKLVNAALSQFCAAIDEAQAKKPFLPTLRGDFGHSWDLWPVSLAKYAADMREGERQFLAAETMLVAAAHRHGYRVMEASRADRERAGWCLAMLSDHAWNGTDERNKRHNADLRRKWSEELFALSRKLAAQAWTAMRTQGESRQVSVFNALSYPRVDLVHLEDAEDPLPYSPQIIEEDGKRVVYSMSAKVPSLDFGSPRFRPEPGQTPGELRATPTELECPFYRLKVDARTGGIASLVHKATGTELVAGSKGRTLCQTVFFDGQEHLLTGVKSEVAAQGHVLARLRIAGTAAGIRVTTYVTVYAELDRVDFDVRIQKPVSTKQERLCQVFPILRDGAALRIETTGAVIRPKPQPEGDLLPGADTKRFAVQSFIDASLPNGPGVTIASLDAFLLRTDLDPITFEALGNDQNYREVTQDQNGVTEFRFRYSLRAHAGGYSGAEAFAWSRSVATPLLVGRGAQLGIRGIYYAIEVDPARAIATCFKPADGPALAVIPPWPLQIRDLDLHSIPGGVILRLRETAGRSGPLTLGVRGYGRAYRTDLLERNLEELKIVDNKVTLDLRAHGFAAVRLLP